MKKILGISAFYHDSAAALTIGDEIIAAAQEERFTRKKQTPDFPVSAIKYCLDESGLKIDELDAIVFYDKPLLKFERLLETYFAFAPSGLISFLKAIPVWINEKIFLKKLIYDGLKEVGKFEKKNINLLFPEHHLSHAASAFYPSNLEESAILTIDGVGEWCTASIGRGIKNKIEIIKELNFPHSVGLLYSAFTYYLGFKVNSGEYKLMGLAPYGNSKSEKTAKYIDIIKRHSIRAARVLAHSDVSPSRKCDPGELFDWERLAAAGIGIWPKMLPVSVDFEIGSIRHCQKQLKMIGYGVKITGVLDELTRDTILAFQRHWLPNRLTGKFDVETVWRMGSVLRASE